MGCRTTVRQVAMMGWAALAIAAAGCGDQDEPTTTCEFPGPMVAGTARSDAVADAPARCGQQDHVWLRDASLGEILGWGGTSRYGAALLNELAGLEGFELPRPALYDVVVEMIEYRTQDRGALVPATAAVAFPDGAPADAEPRDTILLLHGTMGFRDGCSASADQGMHLLGAIFASQGYVVVIPDYLGLKAFGQPSASPHSYLVGQATAIASLDALRAAGRMELEARGGSCMSNRFVALGGSQGGHAALWVDRLAPYYAGELEMRGAVAAVPPADIVGQVERALIDNVPATGNTIAFLGTAPDWYGYGDRLDELFVSPYDVDVPAALAGSCNPGDDLDGVDTLQLADIFTSTLLDAAAGGVLEELSPFGCLLSESGLTTTSIERINPPDPSYGLLFVLGENDDLVNSPIERASFATLCDQGMPLSFLECAGAGHVDAVAWSLGESLDFVDDRFAGQPLDSGELCATAAPVTCRGTP